jgi:hypothetical protein
MQKYEKSWWRSKKFLAFLIMEVLLGGLAVYALLTQRPLGWPLAAFMTSHVVTMGCVAFAFTGQQAKLDLYVRAMSLIGKTPGDIKQDRKDESEEI